MKEYRYVHKPQDLKENDYSLLQEYVNRPAHIVTEVQDSRMVFEDGTEGPFGQFKSLYTYDNLHYLIHESASCCPNSNTIIIEKYIFNEDMTMKSRCTITEFEENYKFTDSILKQTIVIDKKTIEEFIKIIK